MPLTVDAYYDELEGLTTDLESSVWPSRPTPDLSDPRAYLEQMPEQLAIYFREAAPQVERFALRVAELNPPTELRVAHHDFELAAKDMAAFFDNAAQLLDRDKSEEAVQLVSVGLVFGSAMSRYHATCRELVELSRSMNRSADLFCASL